VPDENVALDGGERRRQVAPPPRLKRSSPNLRSLLLLFLLALGLRTGYFLMVRSGPLANSDSLEYEDLANKIEHGQPYEGHFDGHAGFSLDLVRPPGYPAFLAAVNSSLGISRTRTVALQCLMGACFSVVLAVVIGVLFGEIAGLLAGVLYATDWTTIVHASIVVSETLFAVLLGTAICFYLLATRKRSALLTLLAGLFLGLAVLVKPIGQVVVLAFLFGWFGQEKRRSAGLLFLLSYALCVAPWMLRNDQRYGIATVSVIDTINFYLYTAQASAHPHPIADLAGSGINRDLDRIRREWASRPLSALERKRSMEREAWPLIRQHWPMVLQQAAMGMARTCVGTGFVTVASALSDPPGRLKRLLLATLPFAQLLPLWVLAIVGTLRASIGVERSVRVTLAASVIFLLVPAASAVGQSRFRVPAVPSLAVLGALGCVHLGNKFSFYRS
jgi:4-amino-4-deoxy-L-arabinose transferase-like glycosyltransferase